MKPTLRVQLKSGSLLIDVAQCHSSGQILDCCLLILGRPQSETGCGGPARPVVVAVSMQKLFVL